MPPISKKLSLSQQSTVPTSCTLPETANTANVSKVRVVKVNEYKKAAKTLYKAFVNDRVAKYLTNHLAHDPELRKQCDLALFEAYVYSHILKGVVIAIDFDKKASRGKPKSAADGSGIPDEECFETVAVWAKPGVDVESSLNLIRSGYIKVAWLFGSEGRNRIFSQLFPLLHNTQSDLLGRDVERCFTLVYIGSTSSARGKGNARKIFDYMFTNYIDVDEGYLAYLESSALINIPIYEKFGFKQVKDIYLGNPEDPGDDFARMDVMVRGIMGSKYTFNL